MEGVQFLPAWGLERQGKKIRRKIKKRSTENSLSVFRFWIVFGLSGRGNDQSTLLYAASAPSLRIF